MSIRWCARRPSSSGCCREIEAAPGIVLYTLVEQDLAQPARGSLPRHAARRICPCSSRSMPCCNPISARHSTARPGAQHVLNAEYFKRIDAMNFTLLHDDGHLPHDLDEADVVLVGVSRTSKTPTAIYLANRGIKTANIPLVPGMPPPRRARDQRKPLIVGLVATPGADRADPPEPPARRCKPTTTPPMWTATRWRRRSPPRGGSSPATTGR